MGYDITKLIEQSTKKEYFNVPVSKKSLRFLFIKGKGDIASKLNDLLESDGDGGTDETQVIKLEKQYNLNIKEQLGLRSDRFRAAKINELVAAIGQVKKCTQDQARIVLQSFDKWGSLPKGLQKDITEFYISEFAENSENSLPARQVTTIIQSRLIETWTLEETLNLTSDIFQYFLQFFNGESIGWADKKEEEDYVNFDVDITAIKDEEDPLIGLKSVEALPEG